MKPVTMPATMDYNTYRYMLLILFVGLAWRDPELMRMRRPRPLLLETPAYPDLAGSHRLVSLWVILGFSLYFLFISLL